MARSSRKARVAPRDTVTLSETTLLLRRRLPAPREAVFSAWTEPRQLRQWSCPVGFQVVEAQVDLRPGGAYRIGMRSPEGNVFTTRGVYREVRPPERLSYTWQWEDPAAVETLVTVEFHDYGQETELVLRHERFANAAGRDSHLSGWRGCLQNLDALLAARDAAADNSAARTSAAGTSAARTSAARRVPQDAAGPGTSRRNAPAARAAASSRTSANSRTAVTQRSPSRNRTSTLRSLSMAGEFNHLELHSTAVAKSETFYKQLFGWKLQPMPEMHYTLFAAGKGPGGGMAKLDKKRGASHWIPYVRVTNIRTAVRKAKALGAKVTMDVMKIPGYGQIAVLKDPSGAPIGLSQPGR
jgi:uncharacterized protein YndB with AHSA1/START domain/predicted enzyme related to lactoylglutathione lyase